MPRFFTDNISDNVAVIEGEDVTHISRVLRMREGDTLTLCDKKGFDYECEIKEITKKYIECSVLEKKHNQSEPSCCVTLYQGIPKGSKMEYIIQKAVEIGANAIVPVITKRVQGTPSDKGQRWNKIAEEAAKQCGRGIIPKVLPAIEFDDAINEMAKNDLALIPYECEEDNYIADALKSIVPKTAAIIIGPEGGFAPEEVEKAQKMGIKAVTLGKRILRTETAGMYVLANIMYEYKC